MKDFNSAQFSDWVRIGTIVRGTTQGYLDHSAQFSDWVRIGTECVETNTKNNKIAPSFRTG